MNKNSIITAVLILLYCANMHAENIDPYENDSQYAYGQNIGWFNFEPGGGDGALAAGDKLTGYVWAENIGWISLSCENTSSCGTVDYGVTNDGGGNLSGYAWAANIGWISLSCENTDSCDAVDYGVTIDDYGGFDGHAWAENVGWISFDSTKIYNVRACKITFEDLANFTAHWLDAADGPANLDGQAGVDLGDLSIFAAYWLDFCPEGWQL
ncbi:MAG: hypothetical protein ACYS8Z_12925 [Planctomycetota bacterium]|jgi:hypothetical protein